MSHRMRLLALVLVASTVLLAKSPKTTITVKVTDQFNKPLPSASVILDFLGSRQVMKLGKHKRINWEEHTNLQGIAHFPPIPQGMVQIQIIDPHHATFGKRYEVKTPEKTIEIQLKPPQTQFTTNPGPKQK